MNLSRDTVISQYNVSRETMDRLLIYQILLERWQKKTNLVATSTINQFWSRHVADSLQCRRIKPNALNWVDLGSGGGFPGLVIASELVNEQKSSIVLVESNVKKCAFLRTVAREIGVNAVTINKRVESYIDVNNTPDIVTARALTSLTGLLNYCEPWLSENTVGLFYKGRNYQPELEESYDKWQFDLIEHSSTVASDSVILEISKLAKR